MEFFLEMCILYFILNVFVYLFFFVLTKRKKKTPRTASQKKPSYNK